MTNQRLVLLETSYGTGILFDQKDTVQAYQILSRATMVSTGSGSIFPKTEDIEIKLIAPSKLRTASEKEFIDAVTEQTPAPAELPIPF